MTKAVSSNLATANNDGSRFDEANSILSSESRQRASIKYLTEISDNSVEDSNNLVTILDKTGKSAITAVVITELFSVPEDPEVVTTRRPKWLLARLSLQNRAGDALAPRRLQRPRARGGREAAGAAHLQAPWPAARAPRATGRRAAAAARAGACALCFGP